MKRRPALLAAMCIALACGGTNGPEEAANGSTANLSRNAFRVGGTISGLSGTVVLEDNGGDNLIRSVNGSFTFATALPRGSSYLVTVLAQPAGQTCAVANGSGTIAGANVTNVTVRCAATVYFSVAGTLSGLSGTVVLQDNGVDDLSLSVDGTFIFATPVANASPYSVTVLTQPSAQTCTVGNGNGTIADGNVTGVTVTCAAANVCGGFFTGYCVVNDLTGQLTGECFDPGNCISGLSCYCQGPTLAPTVQSFCGPTVDSSFCIF